jgi:hypothetical protein
MTAVLVCLLAIAQAPVTADSINAGLMPGLQKQGVPAISKGPHQRPGKPPRVARIWTVGELTKKFGEPTSRTSLHVVEMLNKTGKHDSYPGERWEWKLDDGTVRADFAIRGYGQSNKAETLRLQIYTVSLIRPK